MNDPVAAVPSLFLREEELRRAADLMFFAGRDLAATLDEALAQHGLGAAHYRALYFIDRQPDLTVGDLLGLLKITKQSLHRVLDHLVDTDLVERVPGRSDRRQRLLSATAKGHALAQELSELQNRRIAAAYSAAGPRAVAGFWLVLRELIDPADQDTVARLTGER